MTGSRFQMLFVSLLLLPGSGLGSDAWTVRSENALPFTKQKADLIVEIPAQPDGRAWAWTSVAPGQEHPAPVTKVQRRDNILQAQVEFFLSHERTRGSVVLGGEAVFHIELRQEGTTWTGTRSCGQTRNTSIPRSRLPGLMMIRNQAQELRRISLIRRGRPIRL